MRCVTGQLLFSNAVYPVVPGQVDSVEGYQGQERKVIIVSSVRSSTEHLDFDLKYRLGFLVNPKRFNGGKSSCRTRM